MAAVTPWKTSNQLISDIKRKISFPVAQATFDADELLAFLNEEMFISQVPSVLQYHEEYFVATKQIALEEGKANYPIPDRAIGMKLRDVFYVDQEGNLSEMTRVNSEDRAFFQSNLGTNESIHKFYVEGNDIILTPTTVTAPTGGLLFVYYLRPNQLVADERAAISKYFTKTLTLDNSVISAGDTVTVGSKVFTAVAGSPSALQFQIGATSTDTATNLAVAINTDAAYIGVSSATTTTIKYIVLSTAFSTSNASGFVISSYQGIEFNSVPDNIINGSIVDFLQTKPGHKTRALSIQIGLSSVSGSSILFNTGDVPSEFEIGDYICLENECIIPQIPTDLHTSLSERACARILAAIGDQQGLQATNLKIEEINKSQGSLLSNRVEGAPKKVLARHSLLRYGKRGMFRRT